MLALLSTFTVVVKGKKSHLLVTGLNFLGFSPGVVELSPSGVALVCQVGDPLELTCSITGEFKRWEFTVVTDSGVSQTFMPDVTPDGVAPPLTVNSTTFTLSRLSAQDSLPLISRMTINHVSEGLNGVAVSCVDVAASESAATTIQIVDSGGRKSNKVRIFFPAVAAAGHYYRGVCNTPIKRTRFRNPKISRETSGFQLGFQDFR